MKATGPPTNSCAHQSNFGSQFEETRRARSIRLVPGGCKHESQCHQIAEHNLEQTSFVVKHHHCSAMQHAASHHAELSSYSNRSSSEACTPPVMMTLRYISRQSQKKNPLLLPAVKQRSSTTTRCQSARLRSDATHLDTWTH